MSLSSSIQGGSHSGAPVSYVRNVRSTTPSHQDMMYSTTPSSGRVPEFRPDSTTPVLEGRQGIFSPVAGIVGHNTSPIPVGSGLWENSNSYSPSHESRVLIDRSPSPSSPKMGVRGDQEHVSGTGPPQSHVMDSGVESGLLVGSRLHSAGCDHFGSPRSSGSFHSTGRSGIHPFKMIAPMGEGGESGTASSSSSTGGPSTEPTEVPHQHQQQQQQTLPYHHHPSDGSTDTAASSSWVGKAARQGARTTKRTDKVVDIRSLIELGVTDQNNPLSGILSRVSSSSAGGSQPAPLHQGGQQQPPPPSQLSGRKIAAGGRSDVMAHSTAVDRHATLRASTGPLRGVAAAAAEGALLLGEEGSLHSHSRMELGGGAHGHGGSGFRGRTPSPREATLQPLPSSTKITGAGPPQHARRTSHTKRSSFGSDLDDDAGEGLTECREDCRPGNPVPWRGTPGGPSLDMSASCQLPLRSAPPDPRPSRTADVDVGTSAVSVPPEDCPSTSQKTDNPTPLQEGGESQPPPQSQDWDVSKEQKRMASSWGGTTSSSHKPPPSSPHDLGASQMSSQDIEKILVQVLSATAKTRDASKTGEGKRNRDQEEFLVASVQSHLAMHRAVAAEVEKRTTTTTTDSPLPSRGQVGSSDVVKWADQDEGDHRHSPIIGGLPVKSGTPTAATTFPSHEEGRSDAPDLSSRLQESPLRSIGRPNQEFLDDWIAETSLAALDGAEPVEHCTPTSSLAGSSYFEDDDLNSAVSAVHVPSALHPVVVSFVDFLNEMRNSPAGISTVQVAAALSRTASLARQQILDAEKERQAESTANRSSSSSGGSTISTQESGGEPRRRQSRNIGGTGNGRRTATEGRWRSESQTLTNGSREWAEEGHFGERPTGVVVDEAADISGRHVVWERVIGGHPASSPDLASYPSLNRSHRASLREGSGRRYTGDGRRRSAGSGTTRHRTPLEDAGKRLNVAHDKDRRPSSLGGGPGGVDITTPVQHGPGSRLSWGGGGVGGGGIADLGLSVDPSSRIRNRPASPDSVHSGISISSSTRSDELHSPRPVRVVPLLQKNLQLHLRGIGSNTHPAEDRVYHDQPIRAASSSSLGVPLHVMSPRSSSAFSAVSTPCEDSSAEHHRFPARGSGEGVLNQRVVPE